MERVERAAAVAGEFVRAAKHRLGDPGGSRVRVALPFIGTAHGGLSGNPGELAGELLVGLRDAGFESGADVVSTIVDDLAWLAAQQVRRDRRSAELWWDLDLRDQARLQEKLAHSGGGEQKSRVLLSEQISKEYYGIVQALLVTRYLLFVGYSLSEDDFHALIDEIESAIGPGPGSGERGSLGTALVVEEEVWGRLWEGVIDIEPVGGHETSDGKADLSENARTLLGKLKELGYRG